MKAVILQDVFSNLFLSVLMLAILALVLVGLPDDSPPVPERCRLRQAGAGDIALAFALPPGSAALGEILWSRTANDLARQTPVMPASRRNFVALMEEGCATSCRVCEANETPALTILGTGVAMSGCRPYACRRAGF